MADYIYLLETRLSKAQLSALTAVREVARVRGLTVFLVGGAVRDLISGSSVRDLDVAVQGNASKLKKDIEKAGGVLVGEHDATQTFYVRFPGGVRVEIGSTLTVTYPKPGKAVVKPATILEDLRRRDFTANAMALSLNEGSYGLLMDPLNGVADIEDRQLRLVSNYGFIEDPVRMIRAARYMARLGWQMEEKTRSRYDTGKEEGYISAMGGFARGYETEEIFHEEDPLRVMRRLEEGWLKHLNPAISASKANVPELERLRDAQMQLQVHGVQADAAAANFPLLTAKMSPHELEELKKSFPRQGFVEEIQGLEAKGKQLASELGSKAAALPSQAYRLLTGAAPEAVLWAAYASKSGTLQAKFKNFYTEWPQARQKIPYGLMQEMRITPDVPQYEELLDKLFFELMDGKLGTTEEMKAFLEPYSPPAPPPPVHLRRPRAAKKDAKGKGRKKAAPEEAPAEAAENGSEGEGASAENESGTPSSPLVTAMAGEHAAPAEAEAVPQPKKAAAKTVPAKADIKVPVPVKNADAKAAGVAHAETRAAEGKAKPAPVKAPAAVKKAPHAPAKVATSNKKAPAKQPAKVSAKAASKKTAVPAKKAAKAPAKSAAKAPAKKGAGAKAAAKKKGR